tara:strand:- start:1377 stop:2027 length:651 start_codon:yes stop_codon:yes gene_type:complete
MYKFKSLYILIFSISIANSQIETAQESLTIKAEELAKKNDNSSNLLKLSPVRGLTNKNIKISMGIPPIDGFAKKEQGIEIKKDVVDPTWDVKQQFSENQKNSSKYSKDFYLGDIKTKSKFIRIVCRDHEYEDGDRIKLVLNNVVIHPNIALRNSGYTIDIKLKEGLNTIEFFALNEGTASPNTAELKVYDENSIIIGSGQWLLTTGYKARLIVLYQ